MKYVSEVKTAVTNLHLIFSLLSRSNVKQGCDNYYTTLTLLLIVHNCRTPDVWCMFDKCMIRGSVSNTSTYLL
jgi:hypothetical protein